MNQEQNKLLAPLHTFAMPARAERWFELTHLDDIAVLESCSDFSWPDTQILAGGSNSIFVSHMKSILQINLKGRSIQKKTVAECFVIAAAGECWDDFVAWTLSNQCFGLENLSLIPGTVGAAPIQNIGAYGVEISDYVDAIQVYDYTCPEKGFFWVMGEQCDFGYRHSQFKEQWSHYLIIHVRFRLSCTLVPVLEYAGLHSLRVGSPTAFQIRQRVITLRQSKLPNPIHIANAGSFFKNPTVDMNQLDILRQTNKTIPAYPVPYSDIFVKIPAAWLLERLGYKGYWQGCFGCYEKQPLVLVHDQTQVGSLEKKSAQFLAFVQEIQNRVYSHFLVRLEIEPHILSSVESDFKSV